VSRQLGLGGETVRRWIVQADIDAGDRPGVTSVEQAEIKRLKAENRRLREDVDILRAANDFLRGRARLPQPLIMAFIDDMRAEGNAESTCWVLCEQSCPVAARTYRAWRRGCRPAARFGCSSWPCISNSSQFHTFSRKTRGFTHLHPANGRMTKTTTTMPAVTSSATVVPFFPEYWRTTPPAPLW
jgi:hypothetical protein